MEARITEINPVAPQPWVKPDKGNQEARVIQPVGKSEGNRTRKVGDESRETHQKSGIEQPAVEDIEALVQDVQEYLKDLNINLNYKVDSKTKEVIVQVLNGSTGDLIRQIPSEELLKLRETLRELRGVLFDSVV